MTLVLNQLSVSSFSEPANNSGWFDGEFYKDRYFVGARGTSGLSVIDYADPENPVEADSIQISFASLPNYARSMGLVLIDDMAYVCCRRGVGNDPGFGIIEEFDISDPYNIVATGNLYDPNNSVLVTPDHPNAYTYMYSDLATDGTHIFVAGQGSGFYKFLASNLGQGPIGAIEAQVPSDVIETQGVAYSSYGDYVLFANYTYGLRILDKTTWGQNVDVTVAKYDTGNVRLRPWQVTCRDGWAYVCVNLPVPDEGSEERGLLTINLEGDVSGLTVSDWNYSPMPPGFNDPWESEAGDPPQLDVSVLGDYCYVSNGEAGVASWYIKDPSNPVWAGQSGDLIDGDNLYLTKAARFQNMDVVVYGDGYQPGTGGSKSLYLAEINQMSIVLGNDGAASGAGGSFIGPTQGRGPNSTYDYTAVSGAYFSQLRVAVDAQPASRTVSLGIYRTDTGARVHLEQLDIDPGGYPYTGVVLVDLAAQVDLATGVPYTFRVTHVSGGSNIELDNGFGVSGEQGRQVATSPDSVLPTDLTADTALGSNDPIIALLGDVTPRTLTTANSAGLVVGLS